MTAYLAVIFLPLINIVFAIMLQILYLQHYCKSQDV